MKFDAAVAVAKGMEGSIFEVLKEVVSYLLSLGKKTNLISVTRHPRTIRIVSVG